ncbi:MAG TPA: hypothetical protein VFJ18_04580, partial [Pararhizobium sp.]|nr:hypothetical protein [Pararhizobium sp.]
MSERGPPALDITELQPTGSKSAGLQFDKLGVVIAIIAAFGALVAPFATFRANRIVAGEARSIIEALPSWAAALLLAVVAVAT